MRPGITARPPSSIVRVAASASRSASALPPTNTMRLPAIATASCTEKRGSTVMILPPCNTMSADLTAERCSKLLPSAALIDHLQAAVAQELAPALGVGADECRELLLGHWRSEDSLRREPVSHGRALERFDEACVKLVDDRLRHAGGSDDPAPGACHEPFDARLRNRGHVGQGLEALRGRDRKRAQLSGLD